MKWNLTVCSLPCPRRPYMTWPLSPHLPILLLLRFEEPVSGPQNEFHPILVILHILIPFFSTSHSLHGSFSSIDLSLKITVKWGFFYYYIAKYLPLQTLFVTLITRASQVLTWYWYSHMTLENKFWQYIESYLLICSSLLNGSDDSIQFDSTAIFSLLNPFSPPIRSLSFPRCCC